jgi:NAD(P)-dependent dehydrogenase (short-subunit alcohol dehydrogenase family)
MIDTKISPVAIVTGSSTGIGRAIAYRFAREGFAIVVNSKTDKEGGHATVDDLVRQGGSATYVGADVSTAAGADAVVETAGSLGKLTVLVNNAGATRPCPLGDWDVAHWRDMLDTNLVSTALMCQAFLDRVDADTEGAIVNIASIRGLPEAPRIGIAAYSAAKAGVINLTKALARACAPNVTVNAISPGFVATDYMNRADDALKRQWLAAMPIKRFIEPQEIADCAAALMQQRALTGANIVIDAGWTVADG